MKTLICVLAVLALASPALAQTYITESVSTNTTWDLGGSPYIIQGSDIHITSASTLTIDPGVTVEFDTSTQLRTSGGSSIVADGSDGNEVLFTSSSGTPAPCAWYAVYLDQSPASLFSYCVFEYGQFNLYINQSDPTISNCTSRNSIYGITCQSASPQHRELSHRPEHEWHRRLRSGLGPGSPQLQPVRQPLRQHVRDRLHGPAHGDD